MPTALTVFHTGKHSFLRYRISNGYFFTSIKGCPIMSPYQCLHCLQLRHKIRQFFRCQTSVGIVSRFVDAIHCRMPVPPDVVSRLVSLAWLTSNGKSHQCTEQPKYKLKSIVINHGMLIIFFSVVSLENQTCFYDRRFMNSEGDAIKVRSCLDVSVRLSVLSELFDLQPWFFGMMVILALTRARSWWKL